MTTMYECGLITPTQRVAISVMIYILLNLNFSNISLTSQENFKYNHLHNHLQEGILIKPRIRNGTLIHPLQGTWQDL